MTRTWIQPSCDDEHVEAESCAFVFRELCLEYVAQELAGMETWRS